MRPAVWAEVADELRALRRQRLARLLTEESVRFATAKALVRAGVDPDHMRYEWPHPAIKGSRVDLVVGVPPEALIELKYPREPNEKNAAWTMIYGEVLKDFYRLAAYPHPADRVFVYAESAQLQKYMTSAALKHRLDIGTDTVVLRPDAALAAPATIAAVLGDDLPKLHVTAHRLGVWPVDPSLNLAVYTVDPAHAPTPRFAPTVPAPATPPPTPLPSGSQAPPGGVRAEILAAIGAITTRSGRGVFDLNDVIVEMSRRGTTYAEATIRTMVVSHMCRNAPVHTGTPYNDLERVGRGLYRRVPRR